MRINHNIASLNTYRQLSTNGTNTQKSLEKLSSGLRINKAGDDAAGLAISEKMRGQIRGLDQASRNSQDGISLIQTAEGALNETHSILQRMRELAVQSATDTNTTDDRNKIQAEVDQLAKEITRISNTTEFNTKNLLAGGLNSTFQIGANADQNINLTVNAMDAFSLGVAGSTVKTSNFDAGTTAATGVTDAGRGLATGTSYSMVVDKTAASMAVAMTKDSGSGTDTAASFTIDDITAFNGTSNAAYQIEVAGKTGNDVTSIRYSTDGGTNWTLVSGTDDTTQWQFDIGNGLTFNIADGAGAGDYATDDKLSFTAGRASATIKLYDPSDVQIGSTVTVYSGSTKAVVGDTANNKMVTLNYNFSTLADSGALGSGDEIDFDVVADASTAATVVNGAITAGGEADTKAGIAVNTQTSANSAITAIDDAIKTVSEERSKLGAVQNRLEHTINNLGTSSENLTAAESRVRDVDMAKEMMEFTKNNILSQAAQAMLAQANQQPQGVLQLLR